MMKSKYLYNTQIINILIALLIGLFVIFPDVVRFFDEQSPTDPAMRGMEDPKIHMVPPDFPDKKSPGEFPPPRQSMERPLPESPKEMHLHSLFFDFLLFFILSWGLLILNNPDKQKGPEIFAVSSRLRPYMVIALTFFICVLGVYINSLFRPDAFRHPGHFPWYLNGILLFKGLFVFVSVVLFGQLFHLLYKQQEMRIENEQLKTESLQNRFDALSAQISPHFFFNSLNSLSGLVRENQNKKALNYISQISNMFRYILRGNWQELITLEEEMQFLEAYQYLLSIKYEERLIFKIDVQEDLQKKVQLPALSIQPLVENIIKHNSVSTELPMVVRVNLKDNTTLVIANSYQPIAETGNNTGIGLSNLNKRYKLLTGKEIINYIEDDMFVVELPLIAIS